MRRADPRHLKAAYQKLEEVVELLARERDLTDADDEAYVLDNAAGSADEARRELNSIMPAGWR